MKEIYYNSWDEREGLLIKEANRTRLIENLPLKLLAKYFFSNVSHRENGVSRNE